MPLLRFLSSKAALDEYFFAVPRLCLKVMGYWPEQFGCGGYTPCALANFIILTIGVVTELHAACTYLQQKNLALALETLCPAGTSAVTLLKMFLILYFRKDLGHVLHRLREMLRDEGIGIEYATCSANWRKLRLSARQRDIIHRHSMLAARLNFWAFTAGFFTCTTYNLKPLLAASVQYLQDKPVVWRTPFNMTMPNFLMHAPFFPFTYVFIAYTGYITIFMFSGCDAFYFEFCAYIAGLFKLLQSDLCALFNQFDSELVLNEIESEQMEEGLVALIRRHNDIINLTKFFRKRYAITTLAHFVSASLVIGISIFDMLTFSGLGMLIYIAYTVAALTQLLIYCYGATLVAENSLHMATVVGTCNWQICRPRERRTVLLIMLRSQRALSMAVPFFSPSLETFAAILQASGSIIALASSFQ